MRELWIDFNDLEAGDEVDTLLSFAEPGRAALTVGASVVVGDDDGTTCNAVVVTLRDGVVRLRLERNTLRVEPPSDVPRHSTRTLAG